MSNNKDFKVKNGIQPTVYHEAVGTVVSGSVGYSLSSARYDSKSFSVASQDANPTGVAFNSDGTKMYITGNTNDNVFQYTLSTAFDVSTASYDNVSLSVTPQTTVATDLTFKPDGSVLYVSGTTAVYQYTLTTSYDLSTASYASKSLTVSGQQASNQSVKFNDGGTSVFIVGTSPRTVFQYTLSTAWDLSTGSYASKSFSVETQDTQPSSLAFSTDGNKMFISGRTADAVYQYSLSSSFDVSTASYDDVSLDVSGLETNPFGLVFGDSGTKMYVVGLTNDTIYQYSTVQTTASLDLSTGSVFDYTPTSDVQVTLTNPAASGTSSGATLLLEGAGSAGFDIANASSQSKTFDSSEDTGVNTLFFKSDGTKLYLGGNQNDTVYQYTCSTAFDITTATYDSKSFSVTSQETAIAGLFFKSDGTKMYVCGDVGDAVFEYDLSTAWDVSTASYNSVSLSISGQTSGPAELYFKSDGTSFYVCSSNNGKVFQYNMTTAWSVSTASYASKSLTLTGQGSSHYGIAFNDSGDKLFVCNLADDKVYQYALTTAWDLATGSYASISYDPSLSNPRSINFSADGKIMYILPTSGVIYQYNSATPATITYDSTLQWSGGTAPTSPAIGETDVLTFNTTDGGTTYQAVQAINGAK